MITEAQKQKIIAAIAGNRVNYPLSRVMPLPEKIFSTEST